MKNEKWQIDNKMLSSILLISLILLLTIFSLSMQILPTQAQGTVVRIIPGTYEFGPGTMIGEEFKIALVVENVTDLFGVGFRIGWDTTYLDYVNHTLTMPWNTSQTPIAPSPYAGLLYPSLLVEDTVDAINGTYDTAYSTLPPNGPFTGNGTAFIMAFRVADEPKPWEGDINTTISLLIHDLADIIANPISHEVFNCTITLRSTPFQHPPLPLLKVTPEDITNVRVGHNFTADINLLGEGDTDLEEFWDVAGVSFTLNFDTTLLEALDLTIDPDSWFSSFWPNIIITASEINNTAGTVDIAFVGFGENHTSPSGQGKLCSITFQSIFEAETQPIPSEYIYLENPVTYTGEYVFDSIGGLIDTTNPVGTTYNMITHKFLEGHYEMVSWEDNGDGMLSDGDQFILNDTTTGFYFDYYLSQITGTLNCTLARTTDPIIWATDSISLDGLGFNGLPGRLAANPSGAAYSGYGSPYWTGNFSLSYPVESVNTITVHALPFTGDEYNYTLTEGVDFVVHADDDLVELLNPVDVDIINECWTDGVNNSLNGWPYINYVASGISSVYVDMGNGTARTSPNAGFQGDYTTGEWWYEPDWPWELEGWWALGYFAGSFNWLSGSTWWINYTAASYLEVDYNTDPTSAYVEFDGTYADFLALTDPTNTTWDERYPYSWNTYTWTGFVDDDTSGTITVGDFLEAPGGIIYRIDGVATDLITMRKPWICEDDPSDLYFGMAPIVSLAGFPQPDSGHCPWHNKEWSVQLPHVVENALYTAAAPPSADFVYLPVEPRENQVITFDASVCTDADNNIANYTWNFGDGSPVETTDQQTITHAFTRGTFNVTLTVTDSAGLTDTHSQLVTVLPPLVLVLTPDSGFASTTLIGSGFDANSKIIVTWDGATIPTVPYPLTTDLNGNFTAIISVLTQSAPGTYDIAATDEDGNTASATFTVVDMTGPQGATGPQGEQGEQGEPGATGPQGEPGTAGPQELLWASLIIAIVALCLALYLMLKKR